MAKPLITRDKILGTIALHDFSNLKVYETDIEGRTFISIEQGEDIVLFPADQIGHFISELQNFTRGQADPFRNRAPSIEGRTPPASNY